MDQAILGHQDRVRHRIHLHLIIGINRIRDFIQISKDRRYNLLPKHKEQEAYDRTGEHGDHVHKAHLRKGIRIQKTCLRAFREMCAEEIGVATSPLGITISTKAQKC